MGMKKNDEFALKKSEIMTATFRYREVAFPFIQEGCVAIRELNYYNVTKTIPAGETAILALCFGKDNRIYGGTGGERAHFFIYDPLPTNDYVIDVGTIGKEKEIRRLLPSSSGLIFGCANPGGILFKYDPGNDYSLLWKCECNKIEICGCPVKNNNILSLAMDKEEKIIYGFSAPDYKFFSYEIKDRRFSIIGNIESSFVSRVLIADDENNFYGSREDGFLFRFNMKSGKIEKLLLGLPGAKGSNFFNAWDAAVKNKNGIIYGGTTEGYIFSLNPATMQMICHGKPIQDKRIRALTIGKDGKIYGIAGQKGMMSHLFYYDPHTAELKDLGIPLTNFPKCWAGYEFDSMVTGKNGEIYLGESDRISHLFIYYPPVEEK